MGRMYALSTFKEYLMKFHPDLDNEHFIEQLEYFRRALSLRMK